MLKNTRYLKGFLVAALFLATACPLVAPRARADNGTLQLSPVIIDEKAHASDILNETFSITNTQARVLEVYGFVYNVQNIDGRQQFIEPSLADERTSLANWIGLTRGVIRLEPGEHRDLPFTISVNLRAKPGEYHAIVAFADGATRDDAEKKIADAPTLTVNLEVEADIKEDLQLEKFIPNKPLFVSSNASFSYSVQNAGNQPLRPAGQVRIYDMNGKELDSFDANPDRAMIEPSSTVKLASVWDSMPRLGHYKAVLTLDYGELQPGRMQDTVYFWVIPWKQAALLAGILVLGILFVSLFLHRRLVGRPVAHARRRKDPPARHVVDLRAPPHA